MKTGDKFTILSKYPCCYGAAKFSALVGFPVETYSRRCPMCHKSWIVERATKTEKVGYRIDTLSWEPDLFA